jgi:hypothetical protein
MKVGQDLIKKHNLTADDIFNFDETALQFALGPTHAYVPKGLSRARGNPNDKRRLTATLIASASGKFGPVAVILHHTKSCKYQTTPDERKMKVVKMLHKVQGFRKTDGWELKEWSRKLTINNKRGVEETRVHKLNSLEKIRSIRGEMVGHIITSQYRAWSDTPRHAWYIDRLLVPLKNRNSGKMLTWNDNCPSHCTQAIKDIYKEHKLYNAPYPPNMTGILQVLFLTCTCKFALKL